MKFLLFFVFPCIWSYTIEHPILNAKSDIEDLDVGDEGDLDDMDVDITPMFREELKRRRDKSSKSSNYKSNNNGIPGDLQAIQQNAKQGTQMAFATLKWSWTKPQGKRGTEELAVNWKSMLGLGLVNAEIYCTDPGRLLFVTEDYKTMQETIKFAIDQDEIDFVEYNQLPVFPKGRKSPLMTSEDRIEEEEKAGYRRIIPKKKLPPRSNYNEL